MGRGGFHQGDHREELVSLRFEIMASLDSQLAAECSNSPPTPDCLARHEISLEVDSIRLEIINLSPLLLSSGSSDFALL